MTRPLARPAMCAGVAALAALVVDARMTCVMAQGRVEAQYIVTLGGIPFGRGSWQIDVRDDHYNASMNGSTTGLLQLFAKGQGSSTVRGTVAGGQLAATNYSSSIHTDKRYDEVRMVMSGSSVRDFTAEPQNPPHPERVPLTDAHRRGVNDPMTAVMLRAPGTGDTFAPAVCHRTLAIFDGRMRYDLQLAFKRLDKVKSERGYQGTAVVCAVYFSPVAGHVPSRSVIKYLVGLRDTEVWLAPIAGTRLMIPYRATIKTPLGEGVMTATQFVSVPHPPRTAATRPQ